MAFFVVIVLGVLTLLGSLAGFRLWLPLRLGPGAGVALWAGVQALAYVPVLVLVLRRHLPTSRSLDWLMELGWLTVGWLSVALFLVLAKDLLLGGTRVWAAVASPPWLDSLRLGLGSRGMALGICGLTTLFVAWGLLGASRLTRVVEVEVPVAGLPPDLEGLRIVQLSDLHIGPGIRRAQVERVARAVQELRPELVVFTGDLADGMPAQLGPEAAPLGSIQAPLGKWFVTGNHEYYSDAPGWMRVAEELGFRVLTNEHVVLRRGAGRLLLAGVPDIHGGRFFASHESRPDLALAGAPPVDFKLLLAHQPASVAAAEAAGYDLMLSGHTHGGQYFPYTWAAGKANPYLKGLNRHSERLQVYVSQGTGYWGPPIRVGTAPEITLLTLRRR